VSDKLHLTTSRDILDALASGHGPDRAIVALGYAGWEAGQLDEEMARNAWLTVPVDENLLFDVPAEDRWQAAGRLLGINLLHLSSRKAVQAALMMADVFPHIDFRREVTIGHLMLDTSSKAAELAKVNPPIRPREDVEFLWDALLAEQLDWVVSDHACCRHEMKIPKHYFGNIWMAKSGFGGTEYLLPALVSEGTRRGMSYNHMARVTSWNPAQRFGLNRKGDIAEGFDADIALVDPARTWTIAAKDSPSTQGYTPFEGLEMSARVDATFLRGMKIFEDGQVIGKPRGQYLHRPTA